MRTSSLARVVMASLGVSVVVTLGCVPPPPAPSPSSAPTAMPVPEPSAAQRNAVLALFDAASVHAAVTTFPLWYGNAYRKAMWTNGPCDFGQGSMQGSVDDVLAPSPGTFLPTGSHTYVVSFSNCPVNYWGNEAFELHGVASAAYDTADWSTLTATVSADSVRGQEIFVFSGLNDVTADGSAVWTRVGSSTTTTTYTPATGARLVNNSTTNVATFGGGSYSTIQTQNLQSGRSSSYPERRFDNLKVAINGTEYTLNGSLVQGSLLGRETFVGEIQIINNGTLVARIYGDARNALATEVLVPLVPF